MLNDRKILKFLPEHLKVGNDRAYTHEEISKLLEIADERMRVIILLMSSSGIRIGSIPSLRLGNLQGSKLIVYEGSKEEYFTFITPEARKAVDSYLDMRRRYGEKLNDKSNLVREQFDIRDSFSISNPKRTTRHLIAWRLISMGERCGIRKRGQNKKMRQSIMVAHGFRKFFMKQCIDSKINPEIREMLMGHNIGLASSYYRPTEQDMLQEYEKVIDSLTINEENRLRKKVEILTIEKSRLDRIEEKMLKMEQMYHQ